jgi:1-phosphatidylinositol-4-phosphate 5-kinase
VYVSGDAYRGEWINDFFGGKGTMKFKTSGNLYDGNWENGMEKGDGIYLHHEKDIIQGGSAINKKG